MIRTKKLKASTAALVMAMLLITIGFLPSCAEAFTIGWSTLPSWLEWSEELVGYPPVHDWIIDRALPFLHGTDFLGDIETWCRKQDQDYSDISQCHYVQSLFNEAAGYINDEYGEIRALLNQEVPDYSAAAAHFGRLLHTVADFYAHSNWVEIWTNRSYYSDQRGEESWLLFEPELDLWHVYADWEPYYYSLPVNGPVNIILAQTHSSDRKGIPSGYVPHFETRDTSAWWEGVAITAVTRVPWVEVPTAIAKTGFKTYDALVTTAGGCTYQPFDMEHGKPFDFKGSDLHKDNPGRPWYDDAYGNAVAQTRHEFWRLLNLVKGNDYRGSSAILGYWLKPNWQQIAPHTGLTATVKITNVDFNVPSGKPPVSGYAFVVNTGDFDSFVKHETPSGRNPEPITLSLESSDTLVIAVEPYQTRISGATLRLDGPENLQSKTYHITNANLDAMVDVLIEGPAEGPHAEAGGPDGYYIGEEGTPVTLSAENSYVIGGGSITNYDWDLDEDGEYDDGTGITVNHAWNDDFFGTVGLRVTDNEGRTSTSIAYVLIENVAPTVEFSHPEYTIEKRKPTLPEVETYMGQELTVKATCFDPGLSDNNTYMIHWGEGLQRLQICQAPGRHGKIGPTISASHVFSKAGMYNVTIRVEDKDGGFGMDLLTVKVAEAGSETPSPQFDWSTLPAILTSNAPILIGIAAAVITVAVVITLYRRRKAR